MRYHELDPKYDEDPSKNEREIDALVDAIVADEDQVADIITKLDNEIIERWDDLTLDADTVEGKKELEEFVDEVIHQYVKDNFKELSASKK